MKGEYVKYVEDVLQGGKADQLSIENIAKMHNVGVEDIAKQLEIGIPIEREHTTDDVIAREVVLDHLSEIPDYYTRLVNMEKSASESGILKD